MANISRIYLLGPGGHRKFYWVQLDDDHSLYVGSSNGNLFSYGYGGMATTSIPPQQIVPRRDGRELLRNEIEGKTSFHGSGVVNLSSETKGHRDRVHITPPRDGIDALPLATVFPTEPTRYPLSRKTIKPTDLCVPEQLAVGLPIGLLIYVCANQTMDPAPVAVAKRRIPLIQEFCRPLAHLSLRVLVYSDPNNLPRWPTEEVQCVAYPERPGGQPNWPFFA